MVAQIIFLIFLIASIWLFTKNIRKIIRNIKLGKSDYRGDKVKIRIKTMIRVAFGQSKMVVRPIPAVLHFFVYAGFIIINIEIVEILIDGIFGTHRVFKGLGKLYDFLIGIFEILALSVWLGCAVFLIRRNVLKIKRFSGMEMTSWPRSDANYILIIEILLMSAFLTMNAADAKLQVLGISHYLHAGSFPVSNFLTPLLPESPQSLILLERSCWWFHIVGVLASLNYLPYSKHLHILLAFPNTYFSSLKPKGSFTNMSSVTNEVRALLDPSFVPEVAVSEKFGSKDVGDLSWVNLMNAYTCTECGKCSSVCPANLTGKSLSPRKIMMDTRDRATEVGRNIDKKGLEFSDGKSLLDDYIKREEIWACTTCNACVEACPININPLEIIIELRRYLVMEESGAPASINSMMNNIENNGAPWQYSPSDRLNWARE
jgi:heterodisulfide reductase subunit C